MDSIDYYKETKWCEQCQGYVRFLMSVETSFCVQCGSKVRLFSKKDMEAFHLQIAENKSSPKKRGRRSRAS
ncbi:MAG: hypothetical protein H6832_00800 [Planctomycetes bacterium]|nr:hypothetical protein [Planctomycetota bacterium]MCB9916922.1 hypothetical protein [Planctomycetota bacterium]